MTEYEDRKRVAEIQKSVHNYIGLVDDMVLVTSWTNRRDLVAERRMDRVKAREQLKEDLIWLTERVEQRTRQGAGDSAMNQEKSTIRMIVEVL